VTDTVNGWDVVMLLEEGVTVIVDVVVPTAVTMTTKGAELVTK